MNKKLIAAAVSAAVAPVAAYGEATVYGNVTSAIAIDDNVETDGSNTDLSTVGSRLGIKYSSDIGNGMTAHGQLEFDLTTDKEGEGLNDTRVGLVGVSGSFGRIDAGNLWSSYSNTVGTLISPSYSLGYYIHSSVAMAPLRSSNTIKYSNDFGPLHAELDIRLNDTDEGGDVAEKIRGNGVGLGLSWAVTDNITLAVAYDHENGADNNTGYVAAAAPDAGVPATTVQFNAAVDSVTQQAAYAAANDAEKVDFIANVIAQSEAEAARREDAGRDPGEPLEAGDFGDYEASANGNPAYSTANDSPDTDRVGISLKVNFGGGYWGSVGWENINTDDNDNTLADDEVDIDATIVYVGGNFGEKTRWFLGYSQADDGNDAVARVFPVADADANTAGNQPRYGVDASPETDDSDQVTWGVSHSLGGGIALFYEGVSLDSENKGWDGDRHIFGMRVNF